MVSIKGRVNRAKKEEIPCVNGTSSGYLLRGERTLERTDRPCRQAGEQHEDHGDPEQDVKHDVFLS